MALHRNKRAAEKPNSRKTISRLIARLSAFAARTGSSALTFPYAASENCKSIQKKCPFNANFQLEKAPLMAGFASDLHGYQRTQSESEFARDTCRLAGNPGRKRAHVVH
jgi:hypothetical protein